MFLWLGVIQLLARWRIPGPFITISIKVKYDLPANLFLPTLHCESGATFLNEFMELVIWNTPENLIDKRNISSQKHKATLNKENICWTLFILLNHHSQHEG